MAFTLSWLADLAGWHGEFAAAAEHLDEAKRLLAELDTGEDPVTVQARLALQRWLLGDRAGAELAGAQREADQLGLPEGQVWVGHVASQLARRGRGLGGGRARGARRTSVRRGRRARPRLHPGPRDRAEAGDAGLHTFRLNAQTEIGAKTAAIAAAHSSE
jgi:hypothetical protein